VTGIATAAADVDRLARFVFELDRGVEVAFALALEEEDFAGPGAGEEVGDAVAVEVHQLGTEADASARGDAAVRFAIFELDPGGELRLGRGADVAIDPENAFAELADQQVLFAVAEEIADERGGVADGGVDRLARGLDADGRQQ